MTGPYPLMDDLIREDLYDGRIVIFTLSSMKRAVVDMWIDACLEVMQACWQTGRDMLILQDLSDPNVSTTPYSNERGAEAVKAFPDLTGRTAFVMPPTIAKHQLEMFLRKEQVEAGFRERRGFTSREAALAWIKESLEASE